MKSFSWALEEIKNGNKLQRQGWNGKMMYLQYVEKWDILRPSQGWSGQDNFEHLPFILMKTADNKLVPWLASQTDILAEDWQIVNV